MLDLLLGYIPHTEVTIPFFGSVNLTPYIAAAIVFGVLSGVFWIIREVIVSYAKKLSQKTNSDVDDVFVEVAESIHSFFYTIVALYFSLQLFVLPSWLDTTATTVFLVVVSWQVIRILGRFVQYGAERFIEKDEDGDGEIDPNAATASSMVRLLSQIVFWALGVIFILSNLGIEVTSLIAGLGIGGIAIAFALQSILGDLFSSFSIYLDKPFRVGDYIVIGDASGTVEKVGIKTTRIRTLQGEELVVPNGELTSSRIQNFKRMQQRRISTEFGVLYETPQELVARIPQIVRDAFDEVGEGRMDRVHFTSFGDSALIFSVVYYVDSSEYVDFLNIQEKFNLALMKRFANEGIEFAYPTQTLYVKK